VRENLPAKPDSAILIYQTEDGRSRIEVRLEDETVWLSQDLMAELFQTTKQNISLHIHNIFKEGELDQHSVVKEYLTTASDGKKYKTRFYNLDVIIAVGYRVRSHRGTQFRRWATERLKNIRMERTVFLGWLRRSSPSWKTFYGLRSRQRRWVSS